MVFPSATEAPVVLDEFEWKRRESEHRERVRRWTGPHRARSARGEKHPVLDFLFTYYKRRPAALERWHPGIGVVLAGDAARAFLRNPGYSECPGGIAALPSLLPPHRMDSVRWIAALLAGCAARPPFFGCSGLHEWAMLYGASPEEVRHADTPLRLPPREIDRVVEALGVRCSHHDAFRFFTSRARPLNRLKPDRDRRAELEQRGCVHVTMDLYKWAYKLEPFTSGELTADAFELAVAARELDMRASPYDLAHLGYAPVPIETVEGRALYEREQRALAARAEPVRARLIAVCAQMALPARERRNPGP